MAILIHTDRSEMFNKIIGKVKIVRHGVGVLPINKGDF